MDEIRILMFIPGIIGGGVEQFIINFVKYLPENCKVNIVYQHEPNEVCLKKFEEVGCKTARIVSKKENPLGNFIQSYKIIKAVNPHIVHSHMNQFSFIPLFAARILRVKNRIAHSHINEMSEKWFTKVINHFGIFLTNLFCNYRLSCGIEASRYLFKNRNSIIIENGIDIKKFKYNDVDRKKIREDLGISNNIVLGNVGRLTNQKNQKKLIKVFSEIVKINSNYRLIIIGSGELKNDLINLVQDLNLTDYIIFIDSTNVIEKYYSSFDLFVLPSLYEGFPVCAVESQVNGIPCIFNDTFDKTTIFNENVSIINFEEDDYKIANYIINLNIKRIDSINKLLMNYDEETSAKKIYSIYRKMIEREVF